MCGINGFSWKDYQLISKMNGITKNRGPDDEGIYCDDNISLGHRRLSIIDLSHNGHQPMSNENQTIWITYNGEIYNYLELRNELKNKGHIFRSNTDTEVVIHAYEEFGVECVKKFNGMWAFCIYDKTKNILVLCRDQFGIKPLYYYIDDNAIIFSSMIFAIFCHDVKKAPNESIIMEYLAYNLEDHKNETFFQSINKLSPDSILIYNLRNKRYSIKKWYFPCVKKKIIVNDIRNLFVNSVRLRTISDVPIGCCLSGGVDSSAIVSVLSKIINEPFNTYSLIVPNSVLDESKYINEAGKFSQSKQLFTTIEINNFLNEITDFIVAQEEPVTGMNVYAQYSVMKLAHLNNAKVLLDGQGGDELFAGYTYYFAYYYYELFISFKWFILTKEMVFYLKNFKNLYPFFILVYILLPEVFQEALWKKIINRWVNYDYFRQKCGNIQDPRLKKMNLTEILSLTLFKTAIPHLLRWEDKNSMRWSIETRPPFLDVNLVESALSLSSDTKLKNGKTKIIFKEAIDDFLPDIVKNRKDKIGFAAPMDDFFRNKLIIEFCNDIIYSESFKNRSFWNWSVIERMYRGHLSKKINVANTIWKWINLELWLRISFE